MIILFNKVIRRSDGKFWIGHDWGNLQQLRGQYRLLTQEGAELAVRLANLTNCKITTLKE